MLATHLFAGVPVADLDRALAWYERLLGRPPDRRPHAREAVWQLLDGGLIYLVADSGRAGHALVTVIVEDLEATAGELRERGLAPGAIESLASGARKLELADPDGNRISFGAT
jgi:catechol 2,3-dioxygenase-like lactoylglutathione lyase family enzyme